MMAPRLINIKNNIDGNTEEALLHIYSGDFLLKEGLLASEDIGLLPDAEIIASKHFSEIPSLKKMTFAITNEDYLEYVKENNLEVNDKSLINYIDFLSKSDMESLMIKSGYGVKMECGLLPFIFANKNYDPDPAKRKPTRYNFVLSRDERDRIKEIILAALLGNERTKDRYKLTKDNISVSPYFINLSLYNNKELIEKLFEFAETDFCEIEERFKTFEIQTTTEQFPIDFFAVFVAVKYPIPPVITRSYLTTGLHVAKLDVDKLDKIFKEKEQTHDVILPNLIYPEQIESFYMDAARSVGITIEADEIASEKKSSMANHLKSDKNKKRK